MSIIEFIQSFSNPFFDKFFSGITFLGDENFFILLFCLVYWCINKKFGYLMGFAFLSNVFLNTVLKETFQIPRPIGKGKVRSLKIESASGYSFPSGHTQYATSYWTSLMIKIKKRRFSYLGITMILLIGLSRIYLGLHTLQDVVGGIVVGVIWVYVANKFFNKIDRSKNYKMFLWVIVPMIIGLFIFQVENYYKIFGSLIGLITGYIIESEYINFKEDGVVMVQVLKYISGIIGLLIIKTVLKSIFPPFLLSHLFRYFLIVIWITVLMPFLVNKYANRP